MCRPPGQVPSWPGHIQGQASRHPRSFALPGAVASPEGVEPTPRRSKGNYWLPLRLDNHFQIIPIPGDRLSTIPALMSYLIETAGRFTAHQAIMVDTLIVEIRIDQA